uniref:Uncharacterized protein n=1 Tax=Arundo donax TaxID=35708 RepID=A0A0A9GDR5_ARUDO
MLAYNPLSPPHAHCHPSSAQQALAHCCVLSGHHGIQSNPCDRVSNLHRKQLKNQDLQHYKKMLAVVPIALTILSECKQN